MSRVASKRGRSIAAAVLVAISLSCGACAAIFGFEELGSENYRDASAGDGPTNVDAGDTGVDAPVVPIPGCDKVGIPDKPIATDAGSSDEDEILVAINTLDIGITTAAGFNLDRACSPTQAFGTCKGSGSGTDFDEFGRDTDDAGTDNAGFALLKTVGAFGGGFEPKAINERLRDGEFGGVIRITKWNGTPDDTDVVFEVFPALGVSVDQEGTYVRKTSKLDAGFGPTDHWHRDTRFEGVGGVSTQFSLNAWVAGGRVYARFAQLVIPVNVPDDAKPLDLTMKEAIISAKLEQGSGGIWRLTDGIVGGRIASKDFLRDVRTIYVLDNNGVKNAFLCQTGVPAALYGLVKTKVCVSRDIVASGVDDRKNGCDAFSVGFRVDTYALTDRSFYTGSTFEALGPDATAPRCVTNSAIPEGDDCTPVTP